MTHPSLGLPPADQQIANAGVGDRVRAMAPALGVRAMEVAIDRDPSFRERHNELALRQLLRDTQVLIDRIALAIDRDDPGVAAQFVEWIAPMYRRRKVPMDDLVGLCEGLRAAIGAALPAADFAPVEAAIDEAIRVARWNRRIAGDARKRNPLLAFLYKGA